MQDRDSWDDHNNDEDEEDAEPVAQQPSVANRRAALMLKMNQALKLNNKAVIDEQLRINDPHFERRQAREEFFESKSKTQQKGKEHMTESAIVQLKHKKRDKPAKETFGWDVFNTDAISKAYEKRVNKIPKLMQGDTVKSAEQRVDMMASEVQEVMDKRNQYSRRRMDDDTKDVTSINERNKVYNKKLERNYKKFSNEIRGNLERGTAM